MDDKNIQNPSPSDGEIVPDASVNDLGSELDTDTEGDIAERGKGKKNSEMRINELVSEVKTAQEKITELEQRLVTPPSPAQNKQVTPDVQKAVEYLKGLGFTQKEDVAAELQVVKDRMTLDTEHSRLKSSYDGADGRPAYDQGDVEKYMRNQGIYNPEIAYKAMHEQELLDWAMKKAQSGTGKKPYIERPSSSVGSREDNTITREKIEEWMKTPEGRIKYEQNRGKILELMTQGKL